MMDNKGKRGVVHVFPLHDCPVCGTPTTRMRYCSKACYDKASLGRSLIARAKKHGQVVDSSWKHMRLCSWCGNQFYVNRFKSSSIECCDDCAKKFIAEGLTSGQLHDKGVGYLRSKRLGWKPKTTECPLCHRQFISCSPGQIHCKMEGCVSVLFNRSKTTRVAKVYQDTGEPACKIVVCAPMNKWRDLLIEKWPGVVTFDEFNELRKTIMRAACKTYVNPKSMALAIFYMIIKRKNHGDLLYGKRNKIAKSVGSQVTTLDTWVKKYWYLVENHE